MIQATALRAVLLGFLILMVSACSDDSKQDSETTAGSDAPKLTVYKTPNCGCCGDWVDHIQSHGFRADVVNQESVAHIKDRFGIPADARSCHTAVSVDDYVFEGHVPARFIQQFMENPPENAVGLIVPAMPLGSPGMEYQDQFNPYTIWLMNKDGSLQAFADITSYDQQFN